MDELNENEKEELCANELKYKLKTLISKTFNEFGNMSNEEYLKTIKNDFLNYYNAVCNDLKSKKKSENEEFDQYKKYKEDCLDADVFKDKEIVEHYKTFFDELQVDDFDNVMIQYEKSTYDFLKNGEMIQEFFSSISKILDYIMNKKHMGKLEDLMENNITHENLMQNISCNLNYMNKFKDEDDYDAITSKDKENPFPEPINDNMKDKKKLSVYDLKNKYIIEHFYNPAMEKKKFKIDLNANMGKIKKTTRSDALINYSLINKKKEMKKISEELMIYNNPSKLN